MESIEQVFEIKTLLVNDKELNKSVFKQIPEGDILHFLDNFERIGKNKYYFFQQDDREFHDCEILLGKVLYPQGSVLNKSQKQNYKCHFLTHYRGELTKYCFCEFHYTNYAGSSIHHSWYSTDSFIPSSVWEKDECWDEGDGTLHLNTKTPLIEIPQIYLRA
jgi:hypothetical protein